MRFPNKIHYPQEMEVKCVNCGFLVYKLVTGMKHFQKELPYDIWQMIGRDCKECGALNSVLYEVRFRKLSDD